MNASGGYPGSEEINAGARPIAVTIFVLGFVTAAVLLLLPGNDLPTTNVWDKLEHGLVFAFLMTIGCVAFPSIRGVRRVAITLIALGTICEVLQLVIPGRSATAADAVANVIGIAAAIIGAWALRCRSRRRVHARG
ncbi:MAG: VanZ family protein [Rhodospirillales bacterium]|nr:VanZ family protein [Rhodospirillales bacterium]